MKKLKDFLSRPAVTAVLFVLAAALLIGSTVTGARANLNIFSENYDAEMELPNIGIALMEYDPEAGSYVARSGHGDLMSKLLIGEADGKLRPGVKYDELLKAQNTATIPVYTRATVYRYWLDPEGNKTYDLLPELIELEFASEADGWVEDPAAKTAERRVFYYNTVLDVGQITATPFLKAVTIDSSVIRRVTQTTTQVGNVTVYTTTFDYDGYSFCIEASVDAVQTHNAGDAIQSAWGCNPLGVESAPDTQTDPPGGNG